MRTSENKRKVLITGASGKVGQALTSGLVDDYDLTLIDSLSDSSSQAQNVLQLDAFDRDILRSICSGIDIVLPLAISGNMHDEWEKIKSGNLIGIGNVYKAAVEMGRRRVVFPSSVQLIKNPTSPYSRSKLWGELSGKRYSARSDLSVICLRLGAVVPINSPHIYPDSPYLDYILTYSDLVQHVKLAIEAPTELRFMTLWAISANKPSVIDYSETCRALGYDPQDDAHQLARRASNNPRVRMQMLKSRIKKWIRV